MLKTVNMNHVYAKRVFYSFLFTEIKNQSLHSQIMNHITVVLLNRTLLKLSKSANTSC